MTYLSRSSGSKKNHTLHMKPTLAITNMAIVFVCEAVYYVSNRMTLCTCIQSGRYDLISVPIIYHASPAATCGLTPNHFTPPHQMKL